MKLFFKNQQSNKQLQLPQTNPLYSQVAWISKKVNYQSLTFPQLQSQNQKILNTLKIIENKLNNELQTKKQNNSKKLHNSAPSSQAILVLDEKIKNNQKLISALKKDTENIDQRKNLINDGLQSKTIQTKFEIERNIAKLKQQIKQLKYEQHQSNKKLSTIDDPSKPQNHQQHLRMQQQLRVLSIKYVRLLDKYNKSAQKLALNSQTDLPEDIQFPEDLYDKQLQQKQQAQYKQYQGIVKLCTVLSHRNDSQHNKAHREYTLKLKQLEKVILKLSQLDQTITNKEGELMESKKNVELMKVRMHTSMEENNVYNEENRILRLSQGSMSGIASRKHSYSSVKLGNIVNGAANIEKQKYKSIQNLSKIKEAKQQTIAQKADSKLRNRGYSMTKLKT